MVGHRKRTLVKCSQCHNLTHHFVEAWKKYQAKVARDALLQIKSTAEFQSSAFSAEVVRAVDAALDKLEGKL